MLKEFGVSSGKRFDVIDINDKVMNIVSESGIKKGLCNIFVSHATAAIIINENYDPNICDDFLDALDELIKDGKWRHDRIDGNGAAHIKAAIVGPSETIPIKDGKLLLGKWQSIMLCDFDGPRNNRIVFVSIIKGV